MKPGSLVEIRNPFMGSDGKRYDNSVMLGILVKGERVGQPSVMQYHILVDGDVRIYLSSLWEIRVTDEAR